VFLEDWTETPHLEMEMTAMPGREELLLYVNMDSKVNPVRTLSERGLVGMADV
jgi:hypothetical protein